KELLCLRDMGVDRVELYTESYADTFGTAEQNSILSVYQKCAELSASMGIGVNAGHDLNLDNLKVFSDSIPQLSEVSIGHALVCDALNLGWEETIQRYLRCLQ
ncbi:MAG: pyridoxine 5'-phosphate synthase, partial [Pseudomonadota bacterium]